MTTPERPEPITEWAIIARLCGAAAFASVIGFERQIKNKPASVRMHIMVSVGAATYVGVALLNTHTWHEWSGGDVNRVAAGIASGVGFLGAGTIFKMEDRVAGLSTAAGIWTVAAIGYSTANGYWLLSTFATLLVLCVQFGLLFILSPHFWKDLREKFALQREESSRMEEEKEEEKQEDASEIKNEHAL